MDVDMKGTGKMILEAKKVMKDILMVTLFKEDLKMARLMVMEYKFGLMVRNMMDNGKWG